MFVIFFEEIAATDLTKTIQFPTAHITNFHDQSPELEAEKLHSPVPFLIGYLMII